LKLLPIDLTIVFGYIAFVLVLGIVLLRRRPTSEEFFLAGRKLPWYMVALSLYATDMSSYAFIAVAGSGFAFGMLYAHYQWTAALCLVIMAAFMLPYYLKSGIFTMPEFLLKRYGKSAENLFSVMTLFIYVVVDIPIALWSAALLLGGLLDVNTRVIIVGVGMLTAFYTLAGGLRAVVYSDFVQSLMILVGGTVVAIRALMKVGGWAALRTELPPEMFHTIRPASDPNLPWTGLVTGLFILGLWYWTTNQTMTQRVLAGKSLNESRLGCAVAGILKFTIPFLGIVPGMCALVLYPHLEKADLAYPTLVAELLPAGLRGLAVATLFAALMSTIDSILNSATTIFTRDIYSKFIRATEPDRKAVVVGRIAGIVFMALGIIIAPLLDKVKLIYNYLQDMYGYVAAPVVVVFFGGLMWRRANLKGALSALIGGIGLSVLLQLQTQISFLHRAGVAALFSAILLVAVSLLTAPPSEEKLVNTTFAWGRRREKQEWLGIKDYRPWAVVVLIILVTTWIVFR
jgi:SSS family solute:Na+ symporter